MESGQQDTGDLRRSRREWWPLIAALTFYSGCFAVALFGSWQSRWLGADAGVIAWVIPVAVFEVLVISRFLGRERSFGTMLVTVLAYGIPLLAAKEYRFLDRFPPAMRSSMADPLPWARTWILVVGVLVYLALVFRAVWIYRNRGLAAVCGGDHTQASTDN